MAAKKKPADQQTPDEFILPEGSGDPLSDFFSQFPNANRKFKIGRYVGNTVEHLETTTDIPDEDQLQEIYGGGRFVIRAFSDGIQRGQIEMRIANKPGHTPVVPESPEPEKKNDPISNDDSFFKQMFMKMMAGGGMIPQQQTPVNELAEALKTIHSLGGSNTNAAKEYSEGLKAGIELAKNMGAGGGETDWKTELFRMAKDVIPSIATSVASIATKSPVAPSNGKPSPAEIVAISGNANVMDKLLFDGIQKLKGYCLKNTPVDLIIDWIVNNAAEYQDFIRAAFSRSFESFATIDPEISNEPFNKWFRQLYDGLRLAFVPNDSMDDDNDGTDGDARDVTKDAKSSVAR